MQYSWQYLLCCAIMMTMIFRITPWLQLAPPMCTFVLNRKRSSPLHMPRKISVISKVLVQLFTVQSLRPQFQSDLIYN
ncbi:hypothetical protein BC826DRAFT_121437 [Russula brevipes]|nr:hypothetical protein BC826DRAFT_121437 [Russula brevipes]